MNKLKDIAVTVFGSKEKQKQQQQLNGKLETTTKTKKTQIQETAAVTAPPVPAPEIVVGRLETDALPVDSCDNINPSAGNTPTPSAEMTADVVRELSDPNYNSLELSHSATGGGGQLQHATNNNAMMAPNANTMNTMNVNSAQQQLVMQFSNVQKIHFGQVYNIGASSSGNGHRKTSPSSRKGSSCSTTSETATPKTTSIVQMMQSTEEPTHRMLDTVSTHLGGNYKQVMRELGISEGQIEQAIIDHTNCGGTKEVIHQLLLLWLRDSDDGEGTLGRLTSVLWEKNSRDCVARMKLVWKAERVRKPRNEVK